CAGAPPERPSDLRFDTAHARDGDLKPLADAETARTFESAALVRKVRQPRSRTAAVIAVHDRIDVDRMAVLPPAPTLPTLHCLTSPNGHKLPPHLGSNRLTSI